MPLQGTTPVIRAILRILAKVHIETLATQAALIGISPESFQVLEQTREAIRALWKPVLDSLDESTPDSLEDMLRNFEGPLQ
jgi:hypothetical protein